MTKRSWVVNPEPPYNLIPKEEYVRPERANFHIMPDMPDFVSPIDKTVVKGRKGYREHCRRHNVTNSSDFTQTWKEQEKERKNLFAKDRNERKELIARTIDMYQRKR